MLLFRRNNFAILLSCLCMVFFLNDLYGEEEDDRIERFKRGYIRVVGSATVSPFLIESVERFSLSSNLIRPVVEIVGTGAGFGAFCSSVSDDSPDIVMASRQIADTERALCDRNGVDDVMEIKIGDSAVIGVTHKENGINNLSKHDLFLAISEYIPGNSSVVKNTNLFWNQVSQLLPETKIDVYGPVFNTGADAAIRDGVIMQSCMHNRSFVNSYASFEDRKVACNSIREDGRYVESGYNESLVINKLMLNNSAIGLFSFRFFNSNTDKFKGISINGIEPNYENISKGLYPIAMSMYIYVKSQHLYTVKGLQEFLISFISQDTLGKGGYLQNELGLISIEDDELDTYMRVVRGKIDK